jgi:protein-tyrosine phosphatase
VSGYVDLHCHYVPGVDDGVRTLEESVALTTRLRAIGYERVVATPHIRTAMFDNTRAGLEASFATLLRDVEGRAGLPELGLGAEHFFDDVFWQLFESGRALPYPGHKAALVELNERVIPLRLEDRFFEMQVRGVRPVLAHPERYAPLHARSEPIDPLLDAGALPLLDLMSLVGRYGSSPRRAAERMLEEGVYYAACSDSHRPSDVDIVAEAIKRLERLVGKEEAGELLGENPRKILEGTVDT